MRLKDLPHLESSQLISILERARHDAIRWDEIRDEAQEKDPVYAIFCEASVRRYERLADAVRGELTLRGYPY